MCGFLRFWVACILVSVRKDRHRTHCSSWAAALFFHRKIFISVAIGGHTTWPQVKSGFHHCGTVLKKIIDFVTDFRGSLQHHVCLFYLSSLLTPEMEIHWTMWILNIDWKKIQFFLCWWEILSWASIENCLLRGLPHSSKEYLKLSLSHFSKSLFLYVFFSVFNYSWLSFSCHYHLLIL